MADVFERSDWSLRSAEFGALELWPGLRDERVVAVRLTSPGIDDPDLVGQLWNRWIALPSERGLLDAIVVAADGRLVIRYPAIDWMQKPLSIDEPGAAARRVASWGIEISRVFGLVRECVELDELGWFTCPFVKIDVQTMPRVGFWNPAGSVELMNRVAPEVVADWPNADERALVFAVGQLLLGLVALSPRTSSTPFGQILARCMDRDPARRFQTLGELREALVVVGGDRTGSRVRESDAVWHHLEQGIGFAHLDSPTRALGKFLAAQQIGSTSSLAEYCCRIVRKRGADEDLARKHTRNPISILPAIPRRVPRMSIPWLDIRPVVHNLIDAGRYTEALERLATARLTDENTVAVELEIARCHLLGRESGSAIDHARLVLEREPGNVKAHEIRTRASLESGRFPEALEAVNAWLAAAPGDPPAHYAAAKVLLALGRLADARDACDRATELAPTHLPAMLLRRQIDRSIKRLRMTAGHAAPAPLDLPEHLRDLRELLVNGRNAEAVAILERDAYANDGAAQLLRADLLAFSEQLEPALRVFEHAATLGPEMLLAARLGQATVLVRLGRAAEALALCDALVLEYPSAADPHEGRALALQALGRGDEADEALKRALAADSQRTQMRVKLAGTPSGGR